MTLYGLRCVIGVPPSQVYQDRKICMSNSLHLLIGFSFSVRTINHEQDFCSELFFPTPVTWLDRPLNSSLPLSHDAVMSYSSDEDDSFEDSDMERVLHSSVSVEVGSKSNDKYQAQKELGFNKHLPYAEKIDDEAEVFLARVKSNLARSVLLSEPRPGLVTSCLMMSK